MGNRGVVSAVLVLASALLPATAAAQAQPAPGGVNGAGAAATTKAGGSDPLMRRGTRGGALTTQGRASMKAGDCRHALDAFDQALSVAKDSTVRRDRGLCHEALGEPYPAIDDFRAYLTVHPDAADSENIRGRLRTLQEQVGQGGEAPLSAEDDAAAKRAGGESGEAPAQDETMKGDKESGLDAIKDREASTDSANSSPLRRGHGFIIGPYFNARYWTTNAYSSGEAYGVAMRYAFGPTFTLLTELGYSSVNGGAGATGLGGLTTFVGLEGRIPLDRYVTNAIYLGAGAGYEHLNQGATNLTFSTFLPRARGGWRHVFGPNLGLELGVDVGYALLHLANAPDGGSNNTNSIVVGGNVAFVIGF